MNITELIEIALASSDEQRVEVPGIEAADVDMEAVSGLAQLISELVDNALAFSEPDDRVRLTGFHEGEGYLISVSDRGVGIPDHLIGELNRTLANPDSIPGPEPKLGIALVARIAARHGIEVQLVPGVPGTTARVQVPARLVGRVGQPDFDHRLPRREEQPDDVFARPDEVREALDLTRLESGHRTGSGVVAMSDEAKSETEAFLKKVFAPLMQQRGATERPAPIPESNGNGRRGEQPRPEQRRPIEPQRSATVTDLRVRVPGENFSMVDDVPSTVAAEGAIDIRSALSKYAEGRRSAEDADSD